MLHSKGSLGACTPRVFPHSSMPLSRRTERTLEGVGCRRLLGASAAAPPHMWQEQASPCVSCYPPGQPGGRRDRPRSGAVCPFVRLVSGGGAPITGDRPRPEPVWETAAFSVPPASPGCPPAVSSSWRRPCHPTQTFASTRVQRSLRLGALRPPGSPTPSRSPIPTPLASTWARRSPGAPCPRGAPPPGRRFGTCPADPDALAAGRSDGGVPTVARASPGVAWIPVCALCAARGLQGLLSEPRQAQRGPGRPRTARLAGTWRHRLPTYGRLAGALRPAAHVCVLRRALRHRQRLLTAAAHHLQHRHKA